MVVKSRGYGKTWLTALCCIAMGVLYPGSLIAVVSGTAEQATLIVKKIQDYFIHNPEIMREIQCDGHRPVQLSRNKGVCTLKNGSKIESYSVGTMRGNRAKIMVIDESPEVKADDLDAVIGPVRNTKRDICHQRGIADYPSKTISITSACLKSNYFYSMFVSALRDFAKGSTGSFACALDYRSAARVGITDMEFFQKEQRKMPEAKFAMEYGSIFVGAESGSMFPYDLTEGCRTLRQVEYAQPSGSSSDYVIGVDLATSTDRKADNAVICVVKLADMENGAYLKKLVYLRNSWCFVTGIQNDCLQLWILNLVINPFECSAVMFVSWIDGEAQNPSMLVTDCFNRVGKYLFVLSFVKPAAVRICRANLNFLLRFAGGFSGRIGIIVVILVLQRFLSMCDPVFIQLFLQLLFVEKSFFLYDLLLELVAIGTSFYMGCIDKYFTRINQSGVDTGLQKL